jgi:glutamine amidotransferase
MSALVHIVDYGAGNLYSAARAIAKAGGDARITNDPTAIATADRVLLPGVGAFASCSTALRDSGLVEPIHAFVATGRPFMGICVGMQLLFDYSLEFGRHAGLGLIAGHVECIPALDAGGARKVPHIGWTPLLMPDNRLDWVDSVLDGATSGETAAYFVHSYHCVTDDPARVLAEVDYDGFTLTAAVEKDNIVAFQCHPEKSGVTGLKIIENFLIQ